MVVVVVEIGVVVEVDVVAGIGVEMIVVVVVERRSCFVAGSCCWLLLRSRNRMSPFCLLLSSAGN